MRFRDTREFVSFLEERGELRRVKTSVSCELEITELADRAVKSGGPALFFENVDGYDMPVVIGLFGTHQRMAWALGVDHMDQLTERVRKILAMVQGPPSGLVGKARALDLMITGRTISSEEARDIGLINEVSDGDAVEFAKQYASTLNTGATQAIGLIKVAVQEGVEMPLNNGLALERELQNRLFVTEDAQEGLQAFIEKRTPEFKGS